MWMLSVKAKNALFVLSTMQFLWTNFSRSLTVRKGGKKCWRSIVAVSDGHFVLLSESEAVPSRQHPDIIASLVNIKFDCNPVLWCWLGVSAAKHEWLRTETAFNYRRHDKRVACWNLLAKTTRSGPFFTWRNRRKNWHNLKSKLKTSFRRLYPTLP